ncbi:HAD family hydrolase [Waterburya agarophytonicola K14]|uniref:HAD family hydrolase n=1 Tax=Waterburya agarophytonicola KI4 TaxID=2874699 RepID=A0A964BPU9_9CYAN|nr:HAD hydrolase-like protein [Waterburya agarophytonicola]MCC0177378.1 HAD family hydrolase [Waterburya agarophytonicola KI4]
MQPNILALDFDGVICDGLIEYFASTKRAYQQIWSSEIDDSLAPNFYPLRPVIETGWEMPILLRALVLGIKEAEILDDWKSVSLEILESEGLEKQNVVQQLDGVRDSWIRNDLDEWLGLHRFYPGIIERLQQIINSDVELYIVTTKEGRFVKQLLAQQGINLAVSQIIGKESKRPKYETLRIIRDRHKIASDPSIFFVEDRIKALQQVAQQSDLDFINLFLADWGYNLESDRHLANQDSRIKLLSLDQFSQQFDNW